MSNLDLAILWLVSVLAALAAVCAKLGMMLFALAEEPPVDVQAALHWQRRRRWLTYSELAALPFFATAGVSATIYWQLAPAASVIISMVLGALGFGFFLHAVQTITRRRLGIDQEIKP